MYQIGTHKLMGNIQMFLKRIVLPALVGMLMIGATSAVYAQAAKMAQSMTQYKSAAQELVALHNGTKRPKSVKAMTKKIAGATKRKGQAAAAIQATMQKLDAKKREGRPVGGKDFRRNAEAQQGGGRCSSGIDQAGDFGQRCHARQEHEKIDDWYDGRHGGRPVGKVEPK
jgi:hypothetical protein